MSSNRDSNVSQSSTWQKGTKRASESDENVSACDVHSSNDWEHADLGSNQRNQKFMRLMGAQKPQEKDHKGKFVIGDHTPTHSRSVAEETQLRHNLEDEYECSVEHKLAGGGTATDSSTAGHSGLGFHPASTADTTGNGSEKPQKKDNEVDSTVKSTNDWEHADLGDDNRRDKFLRLMGASKTEHHGKFVIGDQQPSQSQSGDRLERISHDLEEQYTVGMEARISGRARSHTGLGYTSVGSSLGGGPSSSVQLNAADSASDGGGGGESVGMMGFVKGSSG